MTSMPRQHLELGRGHLWIGLILHGRCIKEGLGICGLPAWPCSVPMMTLPYQFAGPHAHQFWNLAGKSMLRTCPITEVILNCAFWPCHRPEYSCTSW